MAKGDIHTVPHGDGRANRVARGQRVSNTAERKVDAQAAGRKMAIDRGVEHVVHDRKGQIGERNTYPRSRDPRSTKA